MKETLKIGDRFIQKGSGEVWEVISIGAENVLMRNQDREHLISTKTELERQIGFRKVSEDQP